MKQFLILALLAIGFVTFGQTPSPVYGIIRENYYITVVDPIDPTYTYEQFDYGTIRLGTTIPNSGIIDTLGGFVYEGVINLTGAALNPYENFYIFIGAEGINTIDLNTGEIVNEVALTNPINDSYFDNFRFNNSDSTMYGLARRYIADPSGPGGTGEIYLAKANTNTGVITQISNQSVAEGFALAGSAIDPYEMVYYFSTGSHFVGLDMYDGNIYSSQPFQITNGSYFDNFTYSCADTSIYGLVRQNYYTTVPDPFFPGYTMEVFDSATIKLGKIDAASGIVTTISPTSLGYTGYSLGAGSVIDPETMTFFFSTGNNIVGVSLETGLVTSDVENYFTDGMYFDLMRNTENCKYAQKVRLAGLTNSLNENNLFDDNVVIYPNPAEQNVILKSSQSITDIEIHNSVGQLILKQSAYTKEINLNTQAFDSGIYLVKLALANNNSIIKKLIIK